MSWTLRLPFKTPKRVMFHRSGLLTALFFVVLVTVGGACSHSIHQLYVSSMDPGATYAQGRWVTVEVKDAVVLSFEMDSRYIERGRQALEEKCKGRVSQVTVEHLTSFKFLSYDQRLILRGLCLA